MPLALAGIGAAASIGGALVGSAAAGSNREAAAAAAQKAADIISATGAPPDLSKQIYMEQFRSAGLLTPEMEKEINVQFEKVQRPNKQTLDAQIQALQGLSQSAKGGMTAEERVAQNQIRDKQARENEAAKNSIIQNLAARGQAGGGAELALRLQAAQSGANQASEESDRVAAAAQARALQSLGMLGNLSGSMRGQEFSENQANANIANEQNRFNVANQISQQSRNVSAKNAAQAGNLTNAQNILNANTGMANQEKLRQENAQRQYWQDQMDQAKAKSNAYTGQANNLNTQAQATETRGAGIGAGLGTAFGSAAQYASNEKLLNRLYPEKEKFGPGFFEGGVVPKPDQCYNQGGPVQTGLMSSEAEYNHGGMVRGPEIVPGDSPENDVVHARLEGGEYVVPKQDAPSMQLIHAILKGLKK